MEFLIGGGLILAGIFLNMNEAESLKQKKNDPSTLVNQNIDYVKAFPKNYYDNYNSKIFEDSNEFIYNSISDLYEQ